MKLIAVVVMQGRPEGVCVAETPEKLSIECQEVMRKGRENGFHMEVEYWKLEDLQGDPQP